MKTHRIVPELFWLLTRRMRFAGDLRESPTHTLTREKFVAVACRVTHWRGFVSQAPVHCRDFRSECAWMRTSSHPFSAVIGSLSRKKSRANHHRWLGSGMVPWALRLCAPNGDDEIAHPHDTGQQCRNPAHHRPAEKSDGFSFQETLSPQLCFLLFDRQRCGR